jgi:hypothetical protein
MSRYRSKQLHITTVVSAACGDESWGMEYTESLRMYRTTMSRRTCSRRDFWARKGYRFVPVMKEDSTGMRCLFYVVRTNRALWRANYRSSAVLSRRASAALGRMLPDLRLSGSPNLEPSQHKKLLTTRAGTLKLFRWLVCERALLFQERPFCSVAIFRTVLRTLSVIGREANEDELRICRRYLRGLFIPPFSKLHFGISHSLLTARAAKNHQSAIKRAKAGSG